MILGNNAIQTVAKNNVQSFHRHVNIHMSENKNHIIILIFRESSYSEFDTLNLLSKRRQVMQGICVLIQNVYWKLQQPWQHFFTNIRPTFKYFVN